MQAFRPASARIVIETPSALSRLPGSGGVLIDRRKDRQRIDARAVHPDGPVKMRTGHSAGRANLPDGFASGDELPLMDIHHRQMCEQ